jgi:hypothetical protein
LTEITQVWYNFDKQAKVKMIICKKCARPANFTIFGIDMCAPCLVEFQLGKTIPLTYIESKVPTITWINCKDVPAPPRDLLVWGKCGMPHIAYWTYNSHSHTECCFEDNEHYSGDTIEFTHWAELPEAPHD